MSNLHTKTLGVAFVALIAAAGTPAQELSIEPYGSSYEATFPSDGAQRVTIVGQRMTTRESVLAEMARYIEAGRPGSELAYVAGEFKSVASRAEVMADLAKAKAEGRFDSSGEHWSGHDAQPQRVASTAPQRVASVR